MSLTPTLPSGKALWHYLLTTPFRSPIPGLLKVHESTLAEDLGWPLERGAQWPPSKAERFRMVYGDTILHTFPLGFRECMTECMREGRAIADWTAPLLWLPNSVEHDPPSAPNTVKSWAPYYRNELPECELRRRAIRQIALQVLTLREKKEGFREAFALGFPDAFDGLDDAILHGIPDGMRDGMSPYPGAPKIQYPIPNTQDLKPPPTSSDRGPKRSGPTERAPEEEVKKFLAYWQSSRLEAGFDHELQEALPDQDELARWIADAHRKLGSDPEAKLGTAVPRYLRHEDDSFAQGRPLKIFMNPEVWMRRTQVQKRARRL